MALDKHLRTGDLMRFAKLLLLCLALCFMAVQNAQADALADIQKRGILRIAVPQDFAPFGSVTSDMKLQGLDIDVATLITKNMGLKLELVPVTSANRIAYLQTRKADLAISTLVKNAEREKIIEISHPYSPYNNSVFGPASLKVSGPADLAGKTIGVARGTFQDSQLTETAPPSAVIKRYEDNNGMIAAYLAGQVQLVGTGDFVAVALAGKAASNKPQMKYIIQESACYVGLLKEEPALMAKVNAALSQAKKSNELNAIVQKWLNVPLPGKMAVQFE